MTETRHPVVTTRIRRASVTVYSGVCRRGGLSSTPFLPSLAMAAFTVKATYNGETRKFSFSDSRFPSYDQLCKQVSTRWPLLLCLSAYRSSSVARSLPTVPLLLSIEVAFLSQIPVFRPRFNRERDPLRGGLRP